MKVLVINSGSSSLKYQLIDMETEGVIAKGTCERIGIDGSKLTHKANGKEFDATTSASDFCDILTEVFTSDDFVFHGITGAPDETREDGKSNITWADNGYVNKEPLEYVAKEKTAAAE